MHFARLNNHGYRGEGYYFVTFAQRDIESIVLKPGFIAGCGLFLKETPSALYRRKFNIQLEKYANMG